MRTTEQLWKAHTKLCGEIKKSIKEIIKERGIKRIDVTSYLTDCDVEITIPQVDVHFNKDGTGVDLEPSTLRVEEDGRVMLDIVAIDGSGYGAVDLDDINDAPPLLGIREMIEDVIDLADNGEIPIITGKEI